MTSHLNCHPEHHLCVLSTVRFEVWTMVGLVHTNLLLWCECFGYNLVWTIHNAYIQYTFITFPNVSRGPEGYQESGENGYVELSVGPVSQLRQDLILPQQNIRYADDVHISVAENIQAHKHDCLNRMKIKKCFRKENNKYICSIYSVHVLQGSVLQIQGPRGFKGSKGDLVRSSSSIRLK